MTFPDSATHLQAFRPVDIAQVALTPDRTTASGAETASEALTVFAGVELGVWEMATGVLHDVEVDEIFLVVDGEATVALLAEDGEELQRISLSPGCICRLTAGMRTRWVATAPLRKLYIMPHTEES